MSLIITTVVVLLLINNISAGEYPEDLPKCNRGDNDCIQNAIKTILTTYPHGNQALGLPSIDPLKLPKFNIFERIDHDDNDDTAPIVIHFVGKNLEFTGFKTANYSVEGFNKDIGSSNVTIKIDMSDFTGKADYVLKKLRFKKRRTNGKGTYFCKFGHIQFNVNFIPTIVEKPDKKQYIQVDQLTIDYIPQNAYVEFSDLMDDKGIKNSKEMQYIQEHATEFYELLRPAIAKDWVEFYNGALSAFFNKFPVDQLFLD